MRLYSVGYLISVYMSVYALIVEAAADALHASGAFVCGVSHG